MARLAEQKTVDLGGFPAVITFSQEMVNVTSNLPELDPSWVYKDKKGHTHYVVDNGPNPLPTLIPVLDTEHYCELCSGEYQPVLWYECEQCGEKIRPGTRVFGPKFIPGVRSAEAVITIDLLEDDIKNLPRSLTRIFHGWEITFQIVGVDVDNIEKDTRLAQARYVGVGFREVEEKPMVQIEDFDSNPPDPDGLYDKYRVFKEPEDALEHPARVMVSYEAKGLVDDEGEFWKELEEVNDFVFVLKPSTDVHARVALAAYAWSVKEKKPELHTDLLSMLEVLEH